MTILQKQSYNLWFNWIADKVIEWKQAKPMNTDLNNCIKAMNEIGQYVNQLNIENEVLMKRISLTRESKNKLIVDLQKQIEDLENKLKQYEI
jgi:hypothetical protein